MIAATNLGQPLPNKPIELVLQEEPRTLSRQFTRTAGENGQSSSALQNSAVQCSAPHAADLSVDVPNDEPGTVRNSMFVH
jgi:hypothetical protein